MKPFIINYQPHLTIAKFHKDNSMVRGLMGPIGSGKTTACLMEIMYRILNHPPDPTDNIKKSMALIIRASYKQLKDTTIRCWLNLFPPEIFGRFLATDLIHQIRLEDVNCDVLFRSLETKADCDKILSLETTFIFINEASQIDFDIIQMLPRRLRYPAASSYPECFRGMIMDSNPPDYNHWWYKTFEVKKPNNWKLFKQPGGLDEKAENIENLPKGYYSDLLSGASENWLNIYRDGNYGFSSDNSPVYPQYNDKIHCKKLKLNINLDIIIGLDFGLTPAAIFIQLDNLGNCYVLDELTFYDTSAFEFAKKLRIKINKDYPNNKTQIYGDPAGNQRSQTDGNSLYEVLSYAGIHATPAPTNSNLWRKEILKKLLSVKIKYNSLTIAPAFKIDPKCVTLRKGLIGGYHYQKKVSQQSFKLKTIKNIYSHPVEALEYALLGVGGQELIDNYIRLNNNKYDDNYSQSNIMTNWDIY